jgi:hypothetical protein
VFIDSAGQPFNGSGVNMRVFRSGHRNDLGQIAGSVTAMANPIRTISGQLKLVDSIDNVVAASASAFREKWQVDADIIPTTVMVPSGCGFVEVPSCSGTMSLHVNPYTRGLLGNFKAYRNYVYYGSRTDTSTAVDTRIRRNGYIRGFGHFWKFNTYNNLIPDSSNTKWLWNTEITRVNSKGQELETHDALNRYTAAQYGFAKNFPVAVTQNAASGQSFYAGFEDNNYNESLNHAILDNCSNTKYIDFSDFTIIDSDTTTVKAHTGKYMVMVPGNSVDSVMIPIAPPDSVAYTLAFGDSLIKSLQNVGDSLTLSPTWPNDVYRSQPTTTVTSTNPSVTLTMNLADTGHNLNPSWTGYIQIVNPGTYTFTISALNNYTDHTGIEFESDIETFTRGVTNGFDTSNSVTNLDTNGVTSLNYSLTLCPGTYQISATIIDRYVGRDNATANDVYSWSCSNCNSMFYKNLSPSTCNATTAMKTDSAMLNNAFNMLPGQKMQFSAWVRQDCGTPCYITNYTHPTVSLQFPGASPASISLHPKGPVIEGWQRVDTMFTVPSNATKAKLSLGSDSAIKVYFDDLRIHPFNADMKTYVYDPQTLRLMAEMDENNYATMYNYDEEGQLIRVKKETVQGVKTIKETRTAKQKSITNVQ